MNALYVEDNFPVGKKILARWSPRDKTFYAAEVLTESAGMSAYAFSGNLDYVFSTLSLQIISRNCIELEFSDGLVKKITDIEKWTKPNATKDEINAALDMTDEQFWHHKPSPDKPMYSALFGDNTKNCSVFTESRFFNALYPYQGELSEDTEESDK